MSDFVDPTEDICEGLFVPADKLTVDMSQILENDPNLLARPPITIEGHGVLLIPHGGLTAEGLRKLLLGTFHSLGDRI